MTLIPNSTAARKRLSNRRCAQEVLKAHGIPYVPTKTSYTTDCPNCCGGYLNVKIEHDGVAWYCHHCRQGSGEKFERQEAATELGPVKACYDYTDENGNRLFQVLRFEPLYGPKQFRQRTSPDQKKWSIKGVRLVPFKLPALVAAIDRSETVFIVEGEKDVLTLERLGLTATCNPMGAGKWRSDFNPMFRGADVVIIADNDVPGRAHAREVAAGLFDAAAKVRLLDVSELWPEAGASDDISDWLAAGGAADKLKASIGRSLAQLAIRYT
jgi:DNA primase